VQSRRTFVAFVASCMAMAAMSIDVMLPAFPDMREEFGLASDSTEVGRIITVFFLGLAVGQLVYGPVSDRYGRKPVLVSGLALLIVGGIGASFAPGLGGVLAFRFVWGLGAAAPRSLALAMVRDTYSGDRMARAMSHVMATFIVVPVFAPALGAGVLAISPTWRAVFWIPILAAAGVALWSTRMPETLPPDRRRAVSPGALWDAFKVVLRNRQTLAYGLAATCLFGMMSAYIAGAQTIFDEAYGLADWFPLIFGLIAIGFGAASLLNATLVTRLGLNRVIRIGASYVAFVGIGFAALVYGFDGKPPIGLFAVSLAVLLPSVSIIVPNCNTAAMGPVPHVAGMAAAILGTMATGLGALIGATIDGAYDGSVRPFATGTAVVTLLASALILLIARPTGAGASTVPADVEVAVDSTSPTVALEPTAGD
jgi:MFS transporter, DHA1 family, multidrug resistance protein